MTNSIGITAFGAYIPRLRLQRAVVTAANAWFAPGLKGLGKGERAIAGWDEDVITMAVEASRDCLADADRDAVTAVILGSTTAPNADRQNSVVIKEALNLRDEVTSLDLSGGQRAGLSALLQAFHSAGSSGGRVLCVAAERAKAAPASEGELTQAHAAAAFCVGEGPVLARLVAHHGVSVDFVDHFRETGRDFDYAWETRWVRDEGYGKIAVGAVKGLLAKAGLSPADVDAFILPGGKGVAASVAKGAGLKPEAVRDSLADAVGDAGSAHPLLMLAHALEEARPGQRIVVAAFGGGCEALLLQIVDNPPAQPRRMGASGWMKRRAPVADYTKYLFFNGLIELDRGMRAEAENKQPLTALYRNRKAVLAFVGGRCTKTGTVQFPKSDISVNPNDRSVGTQEDYPLAEKTGRILTYTADSLTYTPDPPCYYGAVEFDGGGRWPMEFCDVDEADVEVGRPMRMMFRIKGVDEQRGFTRYFWKAAPAF